MVGGNFKGADAGALLLLVNWGNFMGVGPFYGKGKCASSPFAPPNSGNPDPGLFVISWEHTVTSKGGIPILIIGAHYPTCQNFEGNKVMVYIGPPNSTELLRATGGKLDPHFTSQSPIAPVARFMPNEAGQAMAYKFALDLAAVVDE